MQILITAMLGGGTIRQGREIKVLNHRIRIGRGTSSAATPQEIIVKIHQQARTVPLRDEKNIL